MRNKNKLTELDIKKYKSFIDQIVVDEEIKREILDKIRYVTNNGKVFSDNGNLFGKIKTENLFDYFELIYDDEKIVFNYTTWNRRKIVNITQVNLKNGNIKIIKTEKVETASLDDENHSTNIDIAKIYSANGVLIYDRTLKYDDKFNSYPDEIVYAYDNFPHNYISLEKNWHLKNNVVINYIMHKQFTSENHSELCEQYNICPNTKGSYVCFVKLQEELFKQYISGLITEEEMIKRNSSNYYEEKGKKK